jgi:hypothetical protein
MTMHKVSFWRGERFVGAVTVDAVDDTQAEQEAHDRFPLADEADVVLVEQLPAMVAA